MKVIADLARLIPVVGIRRDGTVALSGFLLGRRNRIPKFARFIARRMKSGETAEISIGQAVCPEDADALAAELRNRLPAIGSVKICGMGTALGVHGGPGTLIVSASPRVLLENLTVSVD